MLLLFQSIVLPNLTFGCEVWGPWFLHAGFADGVFQNDLEHVRLSFLRVLFGLKSSTPSWNVLREAGWYPLQLHVARQLVRWMNKLYGMPPNTLARRALLDCWQRYQSGDENNWCGKLQAFFAAVGVQPTAFLAGGIPLYHERTVLDKLQCRSHMVYTDLLARAALQPNLDSKLVRYHSIFAEHIDHNGAKWKRARYLNLPLPVEKVKLIARFRLSNHFLAVELGRWNTVPLSERVCTLCSTGSVQDEHHFFFACPALQGKRAKYPRLFASHASPRLQGIFALRSVAFGDRAHVARDICSFLQEVGGVYAAPVAAAP
jgi:hypothetical protein